MSAREGVSRWRFVAPDRRTPLPQVAPPSFAIVIATRDPGDELLDAVESAFGQTRPPDEVIVVDDGSARPVRELLGSYRGRLTLVETPPVGVAAARNVALERARSTFFAVLDDDDVWLPERLESLAELAAHRPDLDILSTDATIESGDTVVGRFHEQTPYEVAHQRIAILDRCFVPWPAVRTERLRAVGGFDAAFVTGEDWEVAMRLILSGCVAGLVDEPLYRYRRRAGSLTANRPRTLADRVRILEKTLSHPGLAPDERVALRRSLAANRRRLARVEAETALLERRGARARAVRLARAPGLRLRERLSALAWAVAPERARRRLERRR